MAFPRLEGNHDTKDRLRGCLEGLTLFKVLIVVAPGYHPIVFVFSSFVLPSICQQFDSGYLVSALQSYWPRGELNNFIVLSTTESRAKIWRQYNAFKPPPPPPPRWLRLLFVLMLLIYCFNYFPLFVGVLCWSLFWYALRYVLSSFAIILTRKRELVALLLLSFDVMLL